MLSWLTSRVQLELPGWAVALLMLGQMLLSVESTLLCMAWLRRWWPRPWLRWGLYLIGCIGTAGWLAAVAITRVG